MSVATIVITATRANAPATTIINRGPTGPAGPAGPAGADSITSATTSDGTADINFNQVGIGTTSPAHKLTINAGNDTTALGIDFPSAHFDFSANSTSGYTTSFHMDDTATTIGGDSAARALIFQTNNTDRLYINGSTGNVGIGTASPGHKLTVIGGNIQTDGIVYTNVIRDNTGGNVSIQDNSGNVGIGTTSPTQKLDVQGTMLVNNEIQLVDANMRIFRSSNDLRLRTGGSDRVTINSSGNVGIGTTSPSQKLDVDGAVKKAVFTVNTLPTATAGTSCYVSDSNHTHHSNVGQVVASGGSNFVPVYYDGTDWRIG